MLVSFCSSSLNTLRESNRPSPSLSSKMRMRSRRLRSNFFLPTPAPPAHYPCHCVGILQVRQGGKNRGFKAGGEPHFCRRLKRRHWLPWIALRVVRSGKLGGAQAERSEQQKQRRFHGAHFGFADWLRLLRRNVPDASESFSVPSAPRASRPSGRARCAIDRVLRRMPLISARNSDPMRKSLSAAINVSGRAAISSSTLFWRRTVKRK